MSNYTPEEVSREASGLEAHGYVAGPAMLRAYAATLRQQAGRVDEGMVERAREAYFNAASVEDGVFTDPVAMRAALTAALAQNTQGEAEGVAEIFDALPYCSERTTFTFSRDKLQALLRHAERARVPDGWVPRAVAEVAQGDLHMLKKAIEARDPWPELLVRVTDTERDLRTSLAAAPSQRAEVK